MKQPTKAKIMEEPTDLEFPRLVYFAEETSKFSERHFYLVEVSPGNYEELAGIWSEHPKFVSHVAHNKTLTKMIQEEINREVIRKIYKNEIK